MAWAPTLICAAVACLIPVLSATASAKPVAECVRRSSIAFLHSQQELAYPVRVLASKSFNKQVKTLQKSNPAVHNRLREWLSALHQDGLQEVRKRPGYHDEPLRGQMKNCRSVRLNQGWRVYYRAVSGTNELVLVGVDHHEYRLSAAECN